MWEVLDPTGSGQIPRADLDLMMGVFGLDSTMDVVIRAHIKAKLPGSSASVTLVQCQELFAALMPTIAKPPVEVPSLTEACAIVSGYYGASGILTLPEARVISNVGRSKLAAAQLQVILALFQQAGGSVHLLDFVSR